MGQFLEPAVLELAPVINIFHTTPISELGIRPSLQALLIAKPTGVRRYPQPSLFNAMPI